MSLAKLVLDEGLLGAALPATQIEILFLLGVWPDELPAVSNAVFGGIAPPSAVAHVSRYCAAADFTRIRVRFQPQLG